MNWNEFEKVKPIAYKSGDWDGKKSDKLLVELKDGSHHVAVMYEGVLDGNEFCDFYDANHDLELRDVKYWLEINH